MPNYRRVWFDGGTYFFTVNLSQNTNARRNDDLLVRHIDLLREASGDVRVNHPLFIHGSVVLPDHLHCVIELPHDDDDFAIRQKLIKTNFSRRIDKTEWRSAVRERLGERGIWQRRFCPHLIRDERDLQWHMNYVHISPVKHGLASHVQDWPYSAFHLLVKEGMHSVD